MNPDVTYASCDAPQEKTDKEVELDEDGNEVSERERAIVFFLFVSFDVKVSFLSFRRSLLSENVLGRRFKRAGARALIAIEAHMRAGKKEEKRKEKKARFLLFSLFFVELR